MLKLHTKLVLTVGRTDRHRTCPALDSAK